MQRLTLFWLSLSTSNVDGCSGKTINTDAELKKLISDKDNVFVTQRDAAPPPTPSTPVQAKPELKGPTATKPEPKASKQADPDSDSDGPYSPSSKTYTRQTLYFNDI